MKELIGYGGITLIKETKQNCGKEEALFLESLEERIKRIVSFFKMIAKGEVNYFKLLESYGVDEEMISEIMKFMESFDFQEVLQKLFLSRRYYITKPCTLEEREEAKKVVWNILKKAYELLFTNLFECFEEYSKLVEFRDYGDHFHSYGKIAISLDLMGYIEILKGTELERKPCIFYISRDILHEIGHQIHYLQTINSTLPEFMKVNLIKVDMLVNELVAERTELLALERKEFYEEDLKDFFEANINFEILTKAINLIGDFIYLKEGEKSLVKYLYQYTNEKYYRSNCFRNKLRNFYKIEFPDRIVERVESMAVLYAKIKARKIANSMPFKDFIKICKGYWAPKTFLKIIENK